MRTRIIRWCLSCIDWLRPKPDLRPTVQLLTERCAELAQRNDDSKRDHMDRVAELVEARQMAGAGPWCVPQHVLQQTDELIAHAHESLDRGFEPRSVKVRETVNPGAVGAYGDIELALQNVEWRREVNFSWLEFSRWGIQQIILISRLYYMKNPIMRRLVDVGAAYVFARGVEISSPDESVNAEIDAFLAANQKTLGHMALTKSERRKDYDGNLFWAIFDDKANKGESNIRLIDAIEIEDIVTDPDDAMVEWYFHRVCTQQIFDTETGATRTQTVRIWYPALGYDPTSKPATIRGDEVRWDARVYHSKAGEVGNWKFGCPRGYPALDWMKEARRYLEACASNAQSNAQIAREIITKGGQQAIEGMKYQLQTTVGPSTPIWDQNPPAVAGASWVSGPGTKLDLVRQRGMNQNPEEVRRYLLMCCMVFGVPETFLGDVSTGNLATATSLDRPTETVMLEKQEAWREDLMVIVLHHLNVSLKAAGGRLRESLNRRGLDVGSVTIRECRRVLSKDGKRMEYALLEMKRDEKDGVFKMHEAGKPIKKTEMVVRVNFPAIREGDLKTLVDATVTGMTLNNRAGQVIGIDEKEGVRKLYDLLDFDNGDELVEEQFPESEYERDRTKIELPPPVDKPPVGLPAGTIASNVQEARSMTAALHGAMRRLDAAVKMVADDGNSEHLHS